MTSLPYRRAASDSSDGVRQMYAYPADDKYSAPIVDGPAHLTRNKTERLRLQGLMRSDSLPSQDSRFAAASGAATIRWKERWDVWMIKDGGWKLFLGAWSFLHLLVFALGFLNYYLKDNLTVARATFGLGYRE